MAVKVTCTECGAGVRGTLDRIVGIALVSECDDGTFTWAGETEVDWDSQETDQIEKLDVLVCMNGHSFTHPDFEVQN
jgi:hypothetical protein